MRRRWVGSIYRANRGPDGVAARAALRAAAGSRDEYQLCQRASGIAGTRGYRELVSTGCMTVLTTYSPILSRISVPTRVEKR